jgi:hypothetical protein
LPPWRNGADTSPEGSTPFETPLIHTLISQNPRPAEH